MNWTNTLKSWFTSRSELGRKNEVLRRENDHLRQRITELQNAKAQAEQDAQERRREKEVLRGRVAAQKKAVDDASLATKHLSEKVAQLREENERLSKPKKSTRRSG